jgi:glutathione S-transferase
VLELDDGRVLIESNAIVFYLADGTPFLPDDRVERAQVVRWLIYEQTDVMFMIGGLRFRLQTGRWQPDDEPAVARRDGAHEVLRILDAQLVETPFLVGGRYTVADIAVYAYAHLADEAGVSTADYPAFRAWVDRVESTPAFIDDLQPYPPNASRLAGRSTYG